ncbi:hypothetical protein B0J12DRAFT_682398 [Macrophomina phaseolina]|uniref:Uncharacterized protein n=1 Tax=Macrophomina phaseolina TaxID=35725 RepID=A0ABQ8FW21_9PEZI|nr:hypothetical protein B0J12DRAFT_682398 [Macrophomina phaseolina]
MRQHQPFTYSLHLRRLATHCPRSVLLLFLESSATLMLKALSDQLAQECPSLREAAWFIVILKGTIATISSHHQWTKHTYDYYCDHGATNPAVS